MAYFSLSLASTKLNGYLEEHLTKTGFFILNSESLSYPLPFLKYNSTSTQGDGFSGRKQMKGEQQEASQIPYPPPKLFSITL